MQNHEPLRARRRRLAILAGLGLAGLVAIAGVVWLAPRDPRKLIDQALAVGRRDPAAGERLIRRAIDASGGRSPDAELALGVLAAHGGNWGGAAARFSAVDKPSCRPDLLLAFGRAALRADRGDIALEALQEVRRRGVRESSEALALLLGVYRERGMKDELIAAARELSIMGPDNPQPWSLLIELLKSEVRRDVECLAAIREALDHDLPEEFRREFEHKLVEQLIVCGDAAGARRGLARLSQSEGASFRLRACEVDLCRLEGRPDEALRAMNRLFPEVRNQSQACLNRGVIYLDLGRYEDAARDLERTVAAEPHNAAAHFKLAEADRGMGRIEAARRHREIAAAIGEKRDRIDELLKTIARESMGSQPCLELSELYRALGEGDSADRWEKRAAIVDGRRPGP